MKAIIRCSLTVVLITSFGACSGGENPAGPSADASAPQMDGGVTLGSGSRATTPPDPTETTTAADSGSTAGRGGVTLGSGS